MTTGLRVLSTVSAPAIPGPSLQCVEGISRGDTLGPAEDCFEGDLLRLSPGALPGLMELNGQIGRGRYVICRRSAFGEPGAEVHPDCVLDLMCENGTTVRALILVEVDAATGLISQTYLVPERPLSRDLGYRIIRVSRDGAPDMLAEVGDRPVAAPMGGVVANRPEAPRTLSDITNA